MPRAGVSASLVAGRAVAIIDEDGVAALTLARVAGELGVSAPSLYKHVDGLDDLLDRVAAHVTAEMAESLGKAIRGKSGLDGLVAIAHAYRAFARAHPGSYPFTQRRLSSERWLAAASDAMGSFIAALASYGVTADDIDIIRFVRSTLHGFVDLERTGGFGLPHAVDDSFAFLIESLDAALRVSPTRDDGA